MKRLLLGSADNGYRVVSRFLWKPLRLGKRTRWLCQAQIIQIREDVPPSHWHMWWRDADWYMPGMDMAVYMYGGLE